MDGVRRRERGGRAAQASLEMTLSVFCAVLLVLGALKVALWMVTRLVKRQQEFETTVLPWPDNTSKMKLEIFE